MRTTFLTLVLLCIMMQNGISQNRNSISLRDIPLHKHFDVGDYKGGIQSWSFDQDSSGILYVANNYGLLEFDGVKWTKYEGNPVFSAGESGQWDDEYSVSVTVIKIDTLFHMWYTGGGNFANIGYSTSPDGINWTRNATNPVLSHGGDGSWD